MKPGTALESTEDCYGLGVTFTGSKAAAAEVE